MSMEEHMNLKHAMKNKDGSYIVEASIILPMFVLAVISLALIINMIAASEKMTFEAACDAYNIQNTTLKTYTSIDRERNYEVNYPFGIGGRINFDFGLLIRGYNGMYQHSDTLSEEDFEEYGESKIVVIFPKYGIRFHRDGCRYLNQDFWGEEYKIEIQKNDAINKGYTACLVCGG